MEKIYFDDDTFIWKTKLNFIDYKSIFLKEAFELIKSMPEVKSDGYGLVQRIDNISFTGQIDKKIKLHEIVQCGIDLCKEIYIETNNPFNKINTDAWVNRVRHKNQKQQNFYDNQIRYHTHTEIQKEVESFIPHYTYVYYIQMPDVMEGDDGVLYFRGKYGNDYHIKPEEDDLIIMEGDVPHTPQRAPKSTIDRIVVAGNVGFENAKKQISLI